MQLVQMQADLRWLFDWSLYWQMLLNVDKRKLLHFGYKNRGNVYTLSSSVITSEMKEKDFGAITSVP